MPYLLDANVLCESSKTQPEARVMQWLTDNDAELRVCSLTLGEVLKGIHLMDQGKRRESIERWYARIERWATRRLVVLDLPVMARWGNFYAQHQRAGRKLPLMDSLLAATALHHRWTVVTRNTSDFPDEVPVVNPWEG